MKNIKPIIFIILISNYLFGQVPLMDSVTLSTYEEFTELSEALKTPDNVIKLTLRKKFPREIYKFKNLQYLDLSKNSIKEIPDSIVVFKDLQCLIASKNGLERLPNNIGKLNKLKLINVNQNNLTRLPYSFGELESLEYADLWSNNLEEFPETLKHLKNLKYMDLRNILIPKLNQQKLQLVKAYSLLYLLRNRF
jgi:Leucine-rich repeat (LRR) protein